MHFLEVAVQHVRGFSPAGRFPLKPGFLTLKPPGAEVSPLAGLALALLFPDGRGGDSAYVAAGQRTGKAAFTMVGQDGVTYRLLRELGGSGGLHRLNPSTQQPELVSQDAAEMGQFLRAQVGLPPRSHFEQLCCLTPSHLPSRRPRPRAAAKPDPKAAAKPSLAGANQVQPAEDIPAAEARLAALEQELVQARAVDELQFQADGVSSQLFEAESRLKSTEGLRAAIQEAEAAWRAEPTPEQLGLPQDILTRLERYPKMVARRDEQLARLRSERDADAAAPAPYVEPLKENRAFWAGLAGGLLCLVLGLFLNGMGKYVALLNIPSMGVAALMALRYVDDLQQAERKKRKGGTFASREKKILEEFEAEDVHIRQAVTVMRVDSYKEIPIALERKVLLEHKVRELMAQLQQMEGSEEFQQAYQQREALRQQVEAYNAKLTEMGAYARDSRELEREMARLKESIALAKAPPAAAAGAEGAAGPEPLEDPSPALLNMASDVFTADLHTTMGVLKDRCVQYLTALTDRRYQGLEWDKEGRGFVLAPGKRVPVGELPVADLDLYYLALRLTVLEKGSARVRLPLLIDDALAAVEPAKLPLLGRMLKHVGTLTQVLHVTAHPGMAQLSDGTVNV